MFVTKVSKDYTNEIGYETLQKDFEVYKKQALRGVTLVKGGSNIFKPRRSSLFIRIYTKHQNFVRYEAEFKQVKAQKLFDDLAKLNLEHAR
jgi:hypothetical protein